MNLSLASPPQREKRLFGEEVTWNQVDMCVMTNILNDTYDVSTAEFVNWLFGPDKLTDDYKKALRETIIFSDTNSISLFSKRILMIASFKP